MVDTKKCNEIISEQAILLNSKKNVSNAAALKQTNSAIL